MKHFSAEKYLGMESTLARLLNSVEFKCSICKNHLSVAPILALENDEYSCGRCKDLIYGQKSNPKNERQTLYEEIAKTLSFPCRNEKRGCQKVLQWIQVEEHERICQFGETACIFNSKEIVESQQCKWRGTSQEIFKHLEEHAETINKVEKLEIWKNPRNQVIRMELFNNILLVILIFLNDTYHVVMIGKDKKEAVKYKFSIFDDKEDNFCCLSRSSTYLPITLQEILEFKLNFCSKFLKPKFFSINTLPSGCTCEAEVLPCCKECNSIIKSEIFTCANNCKYCKICSSNLRYFCYSCNKQASQSQQCSGGYYISNTSSQLKYSTEHYKCIDYNCSFHGTVHEHESHREFCSYIINRNLRVSKLNTPYEWKKPKIYFFNFDEIIFKLSMSKSRESLRLSAIKSTRIKYRFEINFSNSFSSISFFIIPNFDYSTADRGNEIKFPKAVWNQYEINSKLKLNISKSDSMA